MLRPETVFPFAGMSREELFAGIAECYVACVKSSEARQQMGSIAANVQVFEHSMKQQGESRGVIFGIASIYNHAPGQSVLIHDFRRLSELFPASPPINSVASSTENVHERIK